MGRFLEKKILLPPGTTVQIRIALYTHISGYRWVIVSWRNYILIYQTFISILFVASLVSTGGALANESSNERDSSSVFSAPSSSPWRVFGGVTFGREAVSGSEYGESPTGNEFSLSVLLSYQLPRWVTDGGVGWMYSSVAGTNSLGQSIGIRTRAGFVDSSIRYRLGEHWQFGPAVSVAFGTDTGNGPAISRTAEATVYLGGRAVYEIQAGKFPVRILGQGLKDVSISNRQIYTLMAGVQFGVPISIGHEKSYDEDAIAVSSAASERGMSSNYREMHEVRIILDPHRVFFGTSSAVIRPEIRKALVDVGAYLHDQSNGWSSAEISGHADNRGRFQYNQKLSELRAKSVLRSLADGGATSTKIGVHGYSYLMPLDRRNTPEGWAKNRRVELVFHDVDDPGTLRARLDRLQELTLKEGLPK